MVYAINNDQLLESSLPPGSESVSPSATPSMLPVSSLQSKPSMASLSDWQANQCTTLDPLGEFFVRPDHGYSCDPPWLSELDDLEVGSESWADTGHERSQTTNPVPVKRHHDGHAFDIPTPDLMYLSSFDSSDRQAGYLSLAGTPLTMTETPLTTTEIGQIDLWAKLSKASNRECLQDDDIQRLMCSECGRDFDNLQGLNRHTMSSQHKAWRCQELGCGKTYARRDTFLRHRTTHTDSGHTCNVCADNDKHKMFKRKDHLKEHMRNCHPHSAESKRYMPRHGYLWTETDEQADPIRTFPIPTTWSKVLPSKPLARFAPPLHSSKRKDAHLSSRQRSRIS